MTFDRQVLTAKMRWLQVLQLLALLVFLSDAVEITTATAVIRCNPPARGETTRPLTNQTMSTGSFFEYQCIVGYECIDCNMTATCLNTGNWSIPPPNCSIRNCGTPANGTNTKPIPGNIVTTYRHNYTYECADGYEPNSTSAVMTTSCDEQGHWTLKNPPYCTVKDCGRLEDGTNTQPVPSNIPTIYNSSYTYQCNVGFESSAKLTAFCDKSGKWMFRTPPVCKAISCGPPPEGIKTESFVDGYNQEYLDYYKYKCKPGYTTDDEVIAQCLASKRWSILPPTCHAKKCETPPNGENTKAVPNSIATTYGSSYTYECEDGYEAPSAEMETVCNHQGQWTLKPLPVCTAKNCGMPVDGTDTKPVPSDIRTTYRNSYNYECKEGYERASKSAEMMTSCDQQGRWTLNSPPICKKVDCGPPPIGVNTESTSDGYNTKYLDYYRYRCLTGYTTSDTTVVQCLASKSWSHPPPTCHGKTCEKPDNGTNTEPVPDDIDTGYGKSYTYRCKEGFETISTSAEMNTSCNHLGRWTLKLAPICKAISCGPAQDGVQTESFVDGYNQEYLDYFRYRCKPGYTTDDEVIAQCLASKRWSIPPPTCHVRDCGKPDEGVNTRPIPHKMMTTYRSSYTYECIDGFQQSLKTSNLTTFCNESGHWNMTALPECERIPKGCKEFLINNTNLEDGKEYNIFISIKDGEKVRVNCSKKGETAFTKIQASVGRKYIIENAECKSKESKILPGVRWNRASAYCANMTEVEYPLSEDQISAIVSESLECSQKVTYTCATQVNALTPIIQYNGEEMGHLYGTRGYRGLPTLSKLRGIKSDCDCFHHGNNCEGPSGCRCTIIGGPLIDSFDTVTVWLNADSLKYVTGYQFAQHNNRVCANYGGAGNITVGAITCEQKLPQSK